MSRWTNFEKYCLQVTPILEAITRNGLGIDPVAQAQFFAKLETERDEINSKIIPAIPPSILKEKVWKRSPKVMDGVFLRNLEDGTKQWYRKLPFSPRSWQQVQRLAVALGAKLPRKEGAESEDDTSTDDKALKKVAKKFPVFEDIRQYRKRDKMVTSYHWPLGPDSRIHHVLAFHPSTWRKSCRSGSKGAGASIQTIPKRSDLAKLFRAMIVPRPGHVLIEGDSAAIEAVLVGWLAGSERYIRLARAGVHGWVTSALHGQVIPLDISDTALAAACASAKSRWPDDYEKCKRVVHLSNYCGTPRRISEEYPDEFPRESDAARLQQFYFNTEAGQDIKAWQRQTIEVAHHAKGLENHFGLRHRFYSLYAWDQKRYQRFLALGHDEEIARKEAYVLGEDAKRAVAFVPQSDASFVQSDILLRLVERDVRFLGWLVAIVHDSIILDVPRDVADYSATVLRQEMVRPLAQLDGLWIDAEIKKGGNLRDMEVIHAHPASTGPLASGLPN